MDGDITISRVQNSRGPDFIQIEINDKMSRTQVTRVTMSLRKFGAAVTGLACQPCKFERPGPYIGKVHEHRTELVPEPPRSLTEHDIFEVARYLERWEVDGWRAYVPDLFNGHNRVVTKSSGAAFQKVTFHRYVEPVSEYDLMP